MLLIWDLTNLNLASILPRLTSLCSFSQIQWMYCDKQDARENTTINWEHKWNFITRIGNVKIEHLKLAAIAVVIVA